MEKWAILTTFLIVLVSILSLTKPNIGRILLGLCYLVIITLLIFDRITLFFSYPESTTQGVENSSYAVMAVVFIAYSLLTALIVIMMALLILHKHKKVKIGLIGSSIFLLILLLGGTLVIPFSMLIVIQVYLSFRDFDKSFFENIRTLINNKKLG